MSFALFKDPQILHQMFQKGDAVRRINHHVSQTKMNNALDLYINQVSNFSFVPVKQIVGSNKS